MKKCTPDEQGNVSEFLSDENGEEYYKTNFASYVTETHDGKLEEVIMRGQMGSSMEVKEVESYAVGDTAQFSSLQEVVVTLPESGVVWTPFSQNEQELSCYDVGVSASAKKYKVAMFPKTQDGKVAMFPQTQDGKVAMFPQTQDGKVAMFPQTQDGKVAMFAKTQDGKVAMFPRPKMVKLPCSPRPRMVKLP